MIELLLPVVGLAAAFVAFAVRSWTARRRRADVRGGGAATCRALLGLTHGQLRRGRLVLSDREVVWRGGRSGAQVELGGSLVLSAFTEPQERRARPDDVILRLALPAGIAARVLLHEGDAALLVQALRNAGKPDSRVSLAAVQDAVAAHVSRRWPRACLLLSALWLADGPGSSSVVKGCRRPWSVGTARVPAT